MERVFTIEAGEEDLAALKSAHQRIVRHFKGKSISLEMLALIALRSLDPEFLANEVLVSLATAPGQAKARNVG